MPGFGWASTTKNCPTEPASTSISSGVTYYGSNCVLRKTGDVDSFTFSAAKGDIWNMSYGPDAPAAVYICLSLRDPAGNLVFTPLCISSGSYLTTQKLTAAGTYTIEIYEETTNTVISYGVSLERINPAPPDGHPAGSVAERSR